MSVRSFSCVEACSAGTTPTRKAHTQKKISDKLHVSVLDLSGGHYMHGSHMQACGLVPAMVTCTKAVSPNRVWTTAGQCCTLIFVHPLSPSPSLQCTFFRCRGEHESDVSDPRGPCYGPSHSSHTGSHLWQGTAWHTGLAGARVCACVCMCVRACVFLNAVDIWHELYCPASTPCSCCCNISCCLSQHLTSWARLPD